MRVWVCTQTERYDNTEITCVHATSQGARLCVARAAATDPDFVKVEGDGFYYDDYSMYIASTVHEVKP